METKSTFVGTEGGVKLNSETTIDLHLAISILPGDTELDYTLRFCNPFKNRVFLVLGALLDGGLQRLQYF